MKADGREKGSYKKVILLMIIFACCGGAVGYFIADKNLKGVKKAAGFLMGGIQEQILAIMLLLLAVTLLCWALSSRYMRRFGKAFLEETDEEKTDIWENKLNVCSFWISVIHTTGIILAILLLSTTYQMEYIRQADDSLLWAFLVFIVKCVVDGIWEIQYIRQIQQIYPEKKGDPSSRKFQKQWIESCDEAEREAIYQSSYHSYCLMNKTLPLAAFLCMISHLIWNTGMMAVFIVCMLWFIQVLAFNISALKLQRSKLNL